MYRIPSGCTCLIDERITYVIAFRTVNSIYTLLRARAFRPGRDWVSKAGAVRTEKSDADLADSFSDATDVNPLHSAEKAAQRALHASFNTDGFRFRGFFLDLDSKCNEKMFSAERSPYSLHSHAPRSLAFEAFRECRS